MRAAGTSSSHASQEPRQGGIQVPGQFVDTGITRAGQCPYHHQATGGQLGQPLADEMAQTALHPVTDDGATHGLADDETRTRRGIDLPRLVRVRCTACT
ncbi:hypothetical protein ADK59_05875 [Streptomyces sp. XY332]|nr:hypothetical protein VR46_29175 [Streptomyces sp. NRRL S-444]KOY59015.1 hypothetical protein ADK59_05875 [Streptomyces sp. XY332]